MTEQDLVLSVPIESAVCCGHGDIFDGNRHQNGCPRCGDPSRARVRVCLDDPPRAVAPELSLELIRGKEPSGPLAVSAMSAAVQHETRTQDEREGRR